MKSFKEFCNELESNSIRSVIADIEEATSKHPFLDPFGNFNSDKLYDEVLRDIVDVKNNYAVMYKKRLDVLPRNAKEGDTTSGPALAEELLPKIKKALKKYNLDAEILQLDRGPKLIRTNKPLYGSIKIIEL